jgi:hypothetical protein
MRKGECHMPKGRQTGSKQRGFRDQHGSHTGASPGPRRDMTVGARGMLATAKAEGRMKNAERRGHGAGWGKCEVRSPKSEVLTGGGAVRGCLRGPGGCARDQHGSDTVVGP